MMLLLSVILYGFWLIGLCFSYRQWTYEPSKVRNIADALPIRKRAFAPMGWLLMRKFGWSSNSSRAKKRRQYLVIWVDPYHLDSALCAHEMETMSELSALLGLGGPCLLLSPILFAVLCFCCIGYDYSRLQDLKKKSKSLIEELENALTDMLTQFVLSLRSGTLPFIAWKTIAEEGEGALYREMSRVVRDVETGVGLRAAMAGFGRTMPIKAMHDCADLFSQSVEVGGSDLSVSLERLRSVLYQERKREYAMQAERCCQQMLFPSLLLFIGILLLVLTPMLGQQ